MNKCTGIMGRIFGHKWTYFRSHTVVGKSVVVSCGLRCCRCGAVAGDKSWSK